MKKIILSLLVITVVAGVCLISIPSQSTPAPVPQYTQIKFLNFDNFYSVKYSLEGAEYITEDAISDLGYVTNPDSCDYAVTSHKYKFPYASAHLEIWTKTYSYSSWSYLGDMYASVLNSASSSGMLTVMTCDHEWWVPPPE